MKKTYLLSAAFVAIALPSTAMAITPINGSFTVSDFYNDQPSNSGLEISVNPGGNTFSIADLETGPATRSLFKISTPETTVNGDDLNLQPIQVDFSFTNPLGASGSVFGNTVGQSAVLGFFQNGAVTWDAPGIFNFGHNGQFKVTLSDEVFNSGILFGLGKKGATVKGTFELITASTGVPEPSTWAMMILGIGFAGAAMRTRQRQQVRMNFA